MTKRIIVIVLLCQISIFGVVLPNTENLIIHLKADAIAGLSDGADVVAWPDSAVDDGIDGTLSPVSGQSMPTWHSNILGGLPIVRFSDDILSTASQFALPDSGVGITVVALFTGDNSGQDGERLGQLGDAFGGNGNVIGLDVSINRTANDGGSGFRFNNGRSLAKLGNLLTTGFHIGVWQMAQGDQHQNAAFSIDGHSIVLDNINNPTRTTTLPTAGNSFSLGNGMVSGEWANNDFYTGDIAEILVYNNVLTPGQLKQISNYLKEKYDLDGPLTEDLIIHLKADSLSLSNNDMVAVWPDSATDDSVDGTVSAVSGFGTPIYVLNVLNGLPAVRFTRPSEGDAAPDFEKQVLVSDIWSWDKMQGVTVFMVCTGGVATTEQRVVQIGKTGGTAGKCFGCDVSANQSGIRFNNGYCLSSSPFHHGQWHISSRQIAQGGGYGSVWYRIDDISLVQTSTNAADTNIYFDNGNNDMTVGAGWHPTYGLINWYDGDIAEVLVYNAQLTPAQMRQVSSYLNAKYAVYEPVSGKNFTVVAIPDSQGYPNHSNQPASINLFKDELQYIVDNANAMNIAFVAHEGDIVMTSNETQYSRVKSAMNKLLNTIPFGMAPGNHDYDVNGDPIHGATDWNQYFGPDTDYFRDKSWYGDAYINSADTSGMTSWQTFSVGDIDFLHIAFECEPRDAVLNWAQNVIDTHPGFPTILTTHKFLGPGGGYPGASLRNGYALNGPQAVWNDFIKVNPQIFMLFCGHYCEDDVYVFGTSARRTDQNSAGFNVHQMMADYQRCHSGANLGNGGGWIRLLEFSPQTNTIRVETYSTILNTFSSHASLTDGSNYAHNWAAFNYGNDGTGSLLPESDYRSSEFTLPFIFGQQLPRPAEIYGKHIAGPGKSFVLDQSVDWVGSGLAFDPTHVVKGNYDRVFFVNRVSTSSERGLYSVSLFDGSTSGRLRLGSYENPYGCAVDNNGDVYVCYNDEPAVRKVIDPGGSPSNSDMIGNYRNAGDDNIQSVMMVPAGFGGDYDAGTDLIIIDSGLDGDDNEAVVILDSSSTESSPAYTVIWEDTSDYFTSDIRGCASEIDGYCYLVPMTIPLARLDGVNRPYISRVKADGIIQKIFLDIDITRGGAASRCDDAIVVNPTNGSIWLATAADGANSLLYPRTIWRIDVVNAVPSGANQFIAATTAEITNAYLNVGVNGMAWSPDGKWLAIVCPDTDKLYLYNASVPVNCADAIAMGYALKYDFNNDCHVNYEDLTGVTMDDLSEFVDTWLDCNDPQICEWLWR